jgi:hypothetical protein
VSAIVPPSALSTKRAAPVGGELGERFFLFTIFFSIVIAFSCVEVRASYMYSRDINEKHTTVWNK